MWFVLVFCCVSRREKAKRLRCRVSKVKCACKLWRVPVLAVSQYKSLHVHTALHSCAGLIDCINTVVCGEGTFILGLHSLCSRCKVVMCVHKIRYVKFEKYLNIYGHN